MDKMKKTPMEIFQAFGQGMMSGTDSWKEVIDDNITFTGPAAQVSGFEAFVELNEGFMAMVRGNRMKKAVEVENFVITQVEIDVAMPSGKTITLDMNEWYEIRDGKIQSIKVYYDAEEFRKESV
jgi:ketosteroid isomerase-like protein